MALAEQLPDTMHHQPRPRVYGQLACDTAANVRAYPKLRGMTLLQIAGICGTTPQTIQRLETANMTMSLDWLQALADALKVEPYQLVGGQGALGKANDAAMKARTELAAVHGAIRTLTAMVTAIVQEQPQDEVRDAPVR